MEDVEAKGKLPDRVLETQLLYMAKGPVRPCSQWDERGHRFLVSMYEGGMGAVTNYLQQPICKEQVLVDHGPSPGLSNTGFRIDYPRNRVVSCATDKATFLRSTVVAYDYTTWETVFFIELAGPTEGKACAQDLTIDPKGDIYVTDCYNGKIWKVKSDGSEFEVFSDCEDYKMRDRTHKYFGWVRLNGISYHRDGFLLVAHTSCHALLKVSMDAKRVRMVDLGPSEGIRLLGDGLVLLQNRFSAMALAGLDVGVHLLETKDAWESATVTQFCPPPPTLLATSVSLNHGQVFASFVVDIRKATPTNILTIGQPKFRNEPEWKGPPPPTRNLPEVDCYTDIYSGFSFPIDE